MRLCNIHNGIDSVFLRLKGDPAVGNRTEVIGARHLGHGVVFQDLKHHNPVRGIMPGGRIQAEAHRLLRVHNLSLGAVQKDMEITDIRLLKKTGGKSGTFERECKD